MKTAKKSITQKKEEVQKRVDQLDTNNNKNKMDKPLVNHGGNVTRDDGFEHRTSEETTDKV